MTGKLRVLAAAAALTIATSCAPASEQDVNNPTTGTERGPKIMTDKRVATYDSYLAAWHAVSDEERRRLLHDSVTDDVIFTNPMQTRVGLNDVVRHLEGFQQRTPNAKFVLVTMLGWENNALATWQFVGADGKPGFTGYDVLHFDDHGRINSILLFSNVEKWILK